MNTLLLNKSDVGSLIDLDQILKFVENGYRSFNSGQVIQPDFLTIVKPGTHLGFDFKSGLDMNSGYVTIKSSSGGYVDNPKLGLPTGMNMVFLYDINTSALKCIMDGTWITGCRTSAAGAISVKYLARKNATRLAMLGSGNQARRQLRAILRVRPIDTIYAYSYSEENTKAYASEMFKETGIPITICSSAEETVINADIIVTTTRGRRGPLIQKKWIKPGTHIVAIGSDMPDKQELSTDIFAGAKIINDSIDLCSKNGETHHAIDDGIIQLSDIYGEIGEILLGQKPGRTSEDEITIFDTVGMAIQDNVMAAYLYEEAVKRNLGQNMDFLL